MHLFPHFFLLVCTAWPGEVKCSLEAFTNPKTLCAAKKAEDRYQTTFSKTFVYDDLVRDCENGAVGCTKEKWTEVECPEEAK